jgi:hypothetical protein
VKERGAALRSGFFFMRDQPINSLRSSPRKRESRDTNSDPVTLGPRFRGDERRVGRTQSKRAFYNLAKRSSAPCRMKAAAC